MSASPSSPSEGSRRISLSKRNDDALEQFNLAIEADPDYGPAYHRRANLYYRLGQYAQARRDFTEVINRQPTQPGNYRSRGILNILLKDFDAALVPGFSSLRSFVSSRSLVLGSK